jgi:hypothetical protein
MDKNYDLGTSMLGDGATPIFYEGEVIEVGTAIFTDEAMTTKAADDRWVLEDGTTIVVLDGAVSEVIAIAVEEPVAEEDMAEPVATEPVAANPSTDVLDAVKPLFEELRGIIAELSSRLDKLENVEPTTEEEATFSKVKDLEDKVEMLSKMAGAPSITKKSDSDVKRENAEKHILSRVEFLKNIK